MKALIFAGGFVSGAGAMLLLILWVLSDTEDLNQPSRDPGREPWWPV